MYQSFQDLPLFMSATQVSEALGISRAQAYQLFHQVGFPVVKIGERRMVTPRDQFLAWVQTKTGESEK